MEAKKLQAALEMWNAIQPLSEKDRERLSRKFSVDFNYNSNHIEGNTLTYGQTELLLLFGKVIGEADFREYEEMKASDVGLKMMTIEAVDQALFVLCIARCYVRITLYIERSLEACRPVMSFIRGNTKPVLTV